MSTIVSYPHLVQGADGKLRIGATRYKVTHLAAEHYHYGWSADEILRQHPDLRPEEVYAALTYFYDHFDEVVDQIKALGDSPSESSNVQPTRSELLKRRSSASP